MKKTLFLVLAMMFATVSFAQQQLATLNHNDTISVFYGSSAFESAHAAAVNGDIITLSPGSFSSTKITKALTIRGAGMFSDTVAGTDPTILLSSFTITINEDPNNSLRMEGIYFAGQTISYSKIYNPHFIKCYFRQINSYNSSSNLANATFINCIINQFSNSSNANTSNTKFVNSVIFDCTPSNNPTLTNCVAKLTNNPSQLNGVNVQNSIVYTDNIYHNGVNAYTSFNSIGLNTGSDSYDYFNSTGLPNQNLYNYRGFASVFKYFTGSYSDGITFELIDEVATSRLGSDGTQMGVYGGVMPFDPSVRNPLIKKCNVASRSTADGKLAVDIEIVSE